MCKALGQEEIKPHKVRYHLGNRDAEFEQEMAEVLGVYLDVQVLKKASAKGKRRVKPMTIVSCNEAIATTAPDLPPNPGVHGFSEFLRLIDAAYRPNTEPPRFCRRPFGLSYGRQSRRASGHSVVAP
ncbi:hypothetical protein ABIB00_007813 [Bradyrhizobium sp. LB14.3]|uniref:hypothetical protein n=1 Tax=Bradyrhizobium sp. LB14.3 TaxID=3156328 RepID=UPI003395D643